MFFNEPTSFGFDVLCPFVSGRKLDHGSNGVVVPDLSAPSQADVDILSVAMPPPKLAFGWLGGIGMMRKKTAT